MLFLCLGHDEAAAFAPPTARSSSTSRARTAWPIPTSRAPGTASRPAPGATACRSSTPPGAADREPRLLRDGRAARLGPLAGEIETAIVDAKSGVSGAGKTLKASSHAGSVLENFSPYAVGAHRHAPEIAQQLGFPCASCPTCCRCAAACSRPVTSRPTPTSARCSKRPTPAARSCACSPDGVAPELSRVQGTDAAEIGIFTDGATGTTIVICALDNLGKGAAGQAVQNANLALGLDETAGLRLTGVLV